MPDKYDRFWFAVAREFAAWYECPDDDLKSGAIDFTIPDMPFGSGESSFTDTARVVQRQPRPDKWPPILQVQFVHPYLAGVEGIYPGIPPIHYEWWERRWQDEAINISVSFEFRDAQRNDQFRDLLVQHQQEIREMERRAGREFLLRRIRDIQCGTFLLAYVIPPTADKDNEQAMAREAARVMKLLVECTWPIIKCRLDSLLDP